jgi:hypothetical protein
VFSAGAVFNLRHKLVHAPHRQFNGIIHMFIVTLGRLSYADPPDWVDSSSKLELERLTGERVVLHFLTMILMLRPVQTLLGTSWNYL